jgi:NAD(P)-dependent dehydrogenase (short-subunit alcohol dehydrogenase family)
MTNESFKGRVAIVTGAGRGMGRTHAILLAALGCNVVVNDRDGDVAEEVSSEIKKSGGQAVSDAHDIVSASDALVARAVQAFGRLDILVNNAGVLGTTLFAETSAATWDAVFDVHLRGSVATCRASWPYLLRSDAGRIINISSPAFFGNTHMTAYGAAKAAIVGFTRCLGMEAADTNVTVNCISPWAWTRMTQDIPDPKVREVMEAFFKPELVSSFVAWLAHPTNRINAEMFDVGAGRAARVHLAIGPAVEVSSTEIDAWFEQQGKLMGEGQITSVHTASELAGIVYGRIVPESARELAGATTKFNKVELR